MIPERGESERSVEDFWVSLQTRRPFSSNFYEVHRAGMIATNSSTRRLGRFYFGECTRTRTRTILYQEKKCYRLSGVNMYLVFTLFSVG